MARIERDQAQAPRRGLTVAETLARLDQIESLLDSVSESAPCAVMAMGGRAAIQACSQMTCVGLVPRFSEPAWEAMAAEHAERQRGSGVSKLNYVI